MGVEPTQDRITAPQTVLKTAVVTGPRAAPLNSIFPRRAPPFTRAYLKQTLVVDDTSRGSPAPAACGGSTGLRASPDSATCPTRSAGDAASFAWISLPPTATEWRDGVRRGPPGSSPAATRRPARTGSTKRNGRPPRKRRPAVDR